MEQAGISVKLEVDNSDIVKGFDTARKSTADVSAALLDLGKATKKTGSDLSSLAAAFKNYGDASLSALNPKQVDAYKKAFDQLRVESALVQMGVASKKAAVGLQNLSNSSRQASFTLQGFSRIAQDAPFGIIGIGNNIPQVLEGFGRLKQEAGSTGAALKALGASFIGAGGLIFALSAGISILTTLSMKYNGLGNAFNVLTGRTKQLTEAEKELQKAREKIISDTASEAAVVERLISVLQNENAPRNEKIEAIKQLNKISPEYFGGLKIENNEVKNLALAYTAYTNNLIKSIEAKVRQGQLEKLVEERLKIQDRLLSNQPKLLKAGNRQIKARGKGLKELEDLTSTGGVAGVQRTFDLTAGADEKRLEELNKQIKDLADGINAIGATGLDAPIKERIAKVKKEIEKIAFVDFALVARVPDVNEFSAALAELRAKIAEETKRVPIPLQTKLPPSTGSRFIDPEIMARAKELADIQDGIAEKNARLVASFQQVLQPAVQEFFQTIITSGGSAIDQLGQTIKRLVTQLVSAVAAAAALAAIVSAITGTPFNTNFKVFLGSGGIPKFANGGVVSGPTLAMVGEYPGARTNPEVIAPLDKLEAMIGAGGGGNLQAVVRGSDLLFILNRATRSQGRQG